jgi:hypothetical protein
MICDAMNAAFCVCDNNDRKPHPGGPSGHRTLRAHAFPFSMLQEILYRLALLLLLRRTVALGKSAKPNYAHCSSRIVCVLDS